jgi:hypothetical protein
MLKREGLLILFSSKFDVFIFLLKLEKEFDKSGSNL